jgi:hypothetical protein
LELYYILSARKQYLIKQIKRLGLGGNPSTSNGAAAISGGGLDQTFPVD